MELRDSWKLTLSAGGEKEPRLEGTWAFRPDSS